MKNARTVFFNLSIVAAAATLLGIYTPATQAQDPRPADSENSKPIGIPEDWSHHRLVFSNPGTEEEAIKNGTHDAWLKIVSNPRYQMQQIRRHQFASAIPSPTSSIDRSVQERENAEAVRVQPPISFLKPKKVTITKDWSMSLGSSGGLSAGQYPAKYSFVTTAASCSDFVVYPTGLPGASGATSQATIVAYSNLYATTCTTATGPSIEWAYNTGASASTSLSPILSLDGTQLAFIQVNSSNQASLVLLKGAAGPATGNVTGSLSAGTPNITLSAGSSFSSADLGAQITGTGIPAGDTISAVLSPTTATLATAPTVHAAETLTITTETITTPGVPPTAASAAAYRTCTAPCMFSIPLNGNPNDTNSSPFYDYFSDVLYVGDNSGVIHKFSGVFSGSPAEVISSGNWPATAASGATLTSPVFDYASGYLFFGSSGGHLYKILGGGTSTGGGTITASASLAASGSTGIVDAPLIDQATGLSLVYVFVGDTTGGITAVDRFNTSFTSATSPLSETVSSASGAGTSTVLYDGAFDNLHYDSTGGTGGNLYVCGVHSSGTAARLYQIAMNSGFSGLVSQESSDPSASSTCSSAVTEFLGAKANTTLSTAITTAPTNTTLAAAINHTTNPTATTLTTAITSTISTSVVAAAVTNIAVGDYISIGTEYMYVSAINTGTKTLTVTRGANGSTAATHSATSTITIYSTLITVPISASVAAGDYIQVSAEVLNVTATNTTTGVGLTLTVTRGVEGTTAATHTSGSPVTVLTVIDVPSTTGTAVGDYIQIDSEIMMLDYVNSATQLTVTQGELGTSAATHLVNAAVQDIQDWIYLSVTGTGSDTGCTSTTGCLYNYSVTTGTVPATATTGIAANGGASGVIIDNAAAATTGAQQIYYTILGNQACTGNGTTGSASSGGCAIQASQSAP